ncbi:hypothetical protein [Streptomyces sp. NPDC056264]
MQLRYSFRVYPDGPQRSALGRALWELSERLTEVRFPVTAR